MYPITDAVKALFEAEQNKVLRITGTDKNGTAISITDDDVIIDSFEIDRYSCNGQILEIGTAISAQLSMKLENIDGRYDSIVFEGAELFVEIGVADWTQANPTITWVPCGYFTPDIQPRRMTTISITALDRMMWFENVKVLLHPWTTQSGEVVRSSSGEPIYFVSNASLTFPCTVAQLIQRVCALCSVPFSQDLSSLPNYNYTISQLLVTDQNISFRNIIQWCAGIMGANAWIDWTGSLRFSWYNNETGYVSTTDNRYNSDLYENAIVITGVKYTYTDDEATMYIAGTDDYAIDLTGNGLVNADNAREILQNIYQSINAFAYTPFSASVIAAPYLWPMDRVVFTDKDGNGHVSALTNVNLSLNGTTALSAIGESLKAYSYGSTGSFSAKQKAELEKWHSNVVADTKEAVDNASAQITGAKGGYVRFMYDENGVMTEILIMNTPDIATATKVWRWNSGGFGYSSNGYQGPFTTAITQDGAIVANFITVGALNASLITTGTLIANIIKAGILSDASGKNFWNMETGEFSLAAATTVGGSTVESIAQNKANAAASTAETNAKTYADGAVDALDDSLTQQSVFNRLTNNGQTQGIYLKNGKLYINATYIDTGTLIANIIKGGTLTLGGIDNTNGVLTLKDDTNYTIGTLNNNGLYIVDMNTVYGGLGYRYIKLNQGYLLFSGTDITSGYEATIAAYVKAGDSNKAGLSFIARRFSFSGLEAIFSGDMTVNGTKSRIVTTDQYSDRLLYCYETPTPMFGDIGDGVISEDGFCYIMLDSVFAQTVTTEQYQVFLQKYGPGDCWVKERKGAYFIVEGTPGMSFGWEIKAKQRDYDQLRLDRNDEKFTVPKQTYGEDAAKHINDIQKERISA